MPPANAPAPGEPHEEVPHAVLLTTVRALHLHAPPSFLAAPIAAAARAATESLRVVVLSPLFNLPAPTSEPTHASTSAPASAPVTVTAPLDDEDYDDAAPGLSRTAHWDAVQRLLTFAYVQATAAAQERGRVLLDVDVLLRGTAEAFPEEVLTGAGRIYLVTPHDTPLPPLPPSLEQRRAEFVVLPPDDRPVHPHPHPHPPSSTAPAVDEDARVASPPMFPVVALGGTFDHLHAGHKILLSMGAWLAREKLIVGITDDALLGSKQYKEVLEPLAVRTARTHAFLARFRPGIVHDVVPINDVYGPTGWDPNVQGLVVSKETLSGASAIDKRRRELGFSPLRTFVIDVISATEASVDAEDAAALRTAKMSSTYIREWIVKHRQGATTAAGGHAQ